MSPRYNQFRNHLCRPANKLTECPNETGRLLARDSGFPYSAKPLPKKANWVAHLCSRGMRKSFLFKGANWQESCSPKPRDRALIFLAPIPKDEV
jgi:hypothetical protein